MPQLELNATHAVQLAFTTARADGGYWRWKSYLEIFATVCEFLFHIVSTFCSKPL